MRKKTRVAKAWLRKKNYPFYMHKGIYFIAGTPVKYWMTPNQLWRYLKKEDRREEYERRKQSTTY